MVGSHAEVADLIEEYRALGIDEFILSGYPHLEEAYWFGEGVLPELARPGVDDRLRAVRLQGRRLVTVYREVEAATTPSCCSSCTPSTRGRLRAAGVPPQRSAGWRKPAPESDRGGCTRRRGPGL